MLINVVNFRLENVYQYANFLWRQLSDRTVVKMIVDEKTSYEGVDFCRKSDLAQTFEKYHKT